MLNLWLICAVRHWNPDTATFLLLRSKMLFKSNAIERQMQCTMHTSTEAYWFIERRSFYIVIFTIKTNRSIPPWISFENNVAVEFDINGSHQMELCKTATKIDYLKSN